MHDSNVGESVIKRVRKLLKRTYFDSPMQRTVIRMAAPFNPAPWATDTMEFDYGVWLGPSSLHCVDSRQLGEENTWPAFFREHPATHYRESSMPGSRSGCVINITALHMVMKSWQEALSLMSAMRVTYDKAFGTGGLPLSMADAFILSKAGCALPALMVRRVRAPVTDGHIPALVATQFKLIAGFFMVAQELLWGESEPEIIADGNAFFDFADLHRIFISPSGRACGGSRKKIVELYDFLNNPGNHAEATALKSFADPDQLMIYTKHAVYLELLCLLVRRALKSAYLTLGMTDPHALPSSACDAEQLRKRIAMLDRNDGIWAVMEKLASASIGEPLDLDATRTLLSGICTEARAVSRLADVPNQYAAALHSLGDQALTQQQVISQVLGRKQIHTLPLSALRARIAAWPIDA